MIYENDYHNNIYRFSIRNVGTKLCAESVNCSVRKQEIN